FLIKDGKIETIDEFGIGGRNFSHALSEKFGLSEERAKALKDRYSEESLSREVKERIKESLSGTLEDWFFFLKSKLKNSKGLLPSVIFLFGENSLLPELEEVLEEGDWDKLSFNGQIEVKFIYPEQLTQNFYAEDKTHALNTPKEINQFLLYYGA
ncbi:MAG: hypothetical protein ABH800_01965, partial [Candidatus Nealsonbacteria bacterium]